MNTHCTNALGILVCVLCCLGSPSTHARVVTDATGTAVNIPDQVQRPIALSETDLDSLLALQIQPIGTTAGRGQNSTPNYLGEAGKRIPLLGGFAAPILDKTIAAQPDLILAGGTTDPKLLHQLRAIAPTVVTYRLGENWKTAFRRIAHILNATAQADTFFVRYQQRTAQLRKPLTQQALPTVSIVRWNPQGPSYMLSDSFASLVLADIGLQRPSSQRQAGIAHSPPLSLEALDRLDADWLLMGTLSPTGHASDNLKHAMQLPVFRQLRAVRNQRVHTVDGSLWTSLGGPLAAMSILNDVEQRMLNTR